MAPLADWLASRLGLGALLDYAAAKQVPRHRHSRWYYAGGLALLLLGVQVATGILLACYYRPGAEAHESVRRITETIPAGAWIRSLHAWSADLLIACLLIHMFSAFFMKAYRRPRELTWWFGCGLLALVLTFGFSGYLLRMDERGYFATQVGVHLAAGIAPLRWAVDLILGGSRVGEETARRFFALHAVGLPWLLLVLIAGHLWLVQHHGQAPLPADEDTAQPPTVAWYPDFLRGELGFWLAVLTALSILAAALPRELGPAADALKPTPADIHPEWYFMSAFEVLRLLGRWLPGAAGESAGFALAALVAAIWLLAPLLDSRGGRGSRWLTAFGVALAAGWMITTIAGYAGLGG